MVVPRDGPAFADFAEIVDRDRIAVELDLEVFGAEIRHTVTGAVGDDDLQVDHPHVDRLGERGVLAVRGCGLDGGYGGYGD